MTQEKIMKRKLVTTIVIMFIVVIALFVFIALYVDEVRKTEETFKKHYKLCVSSASENIDLYFSKGTDLDMRYNMIMSDVAAARTIVFLIKDYTEEQKAMNELHSCFVKYPDQTAEKLEEIGDALDMVTSGEENCYDRLNEIIDSYDKKGY